MDFPPKSPLLVEKKCLSLVDLYSLSTKCSFFSKIILEMMWSVSMAWKCHLYTDDDDEIYVYIYLSRLKSRHIHILSFRISLLWLLDVTSPLGSCTCPTKTYFFPSLPHPRKCLISSQCYIALFLQVDTLKTILLSSFSLISHTQYIGNTLWFYMWVNSSLLASLAPWTLPSSKY